MSFIRQSARRPSSCWALFSLLILHQKPSLCFYDAGFLLKWCRQRIFHGTVIQNRKKTEKKQCNHSLVHEQGSEWASKRVSGASERVNKRAIGLAVLSRFMVDLAHSRLVYMFAVTANPMEPLRRWLVLKHRHVTMVQKNHKSRCRYWSNCPFAHL